jgi:hypothetical protein
MLHELTWQHDLTYTSTYFPLEMLIHSLCQLSYSCAAVRSGRFNCNVDSNAHVHTGIADGVGGWSQVNIDSGVYSRMLMQTAKAAAAITPPSPIAPQIVLEEAHHKTNVKVKVCTSAATQVQCQIAYCLQNLWEV